MALVIVNIICRMVENVVMIAGIIYASVYFGKMSVLWFLLLPAMNVYRLEWHSINDDSEEEESKE